MDEIYEESGPPPPIRNLRARALAAEPLLGVFMTWPVPGLVELAALAGLDFVVVDCEHGFHGVESVEAIVRAADSAAVAALVRAPSYASDQVGRYLDAGAAGTIFPRADGARTARTAIENVKFAPDGRRGLGGARANRYATVPLDEFVRRANEETLVAVQIETSGALDEIGEIASHPGLDVLFVGPNDLSQALGCPGNYSDPRYEAAVVCITGEASRARKAAGIMVHKREQIPALRKLGFSFFTTSDRALVLESARAWRAAVAK